MTAPGTIKLFVDAHVFDSEYQGSRSFIKELYTALAPLPGLQVFMAAHDVTSLQKEFPLPGNIRFLQYRSRNRLYRLLVDIPSMIRQHRVDYAHFQYIVPLFKHCRYIVTIHDVLFSEHPQYFSRWYRIQKKWLYRYAAKRAAILTTVSDYSKQSISKHLGIALQKIHVISHGVAAHFFEPYDKQKIKDQVQYRYGTSDYIFYASRFEPRKNHVLLLEVFLELELSKQNYHLVFAGHHSLETPDFEQLYASLPAAIKQHVHILHQPDDAALLQLYRGATCFVYPSAAEGFGMPPLEAAAAAVPVLCNNKTALADFSFFCKNHIDITNSRLFKERLLGILNNGEQNGETCRIKKHVQEHYSWHQAATTFLTRIKQDPGNDTF
ncbi:MAG: glycosyltransferase family 1 protein [Ferruginibacter sp.]